MTLKLCHRTDKLKERPSNQEGVRLFTCECGKKWSWTENAGYFQQGRPPIANAKKIVKSYRVTEATARELEQGRARIEIVKVSND